MKYAWLWIVSGTGVIGLGGCGPSSPPPSSATTDSGPRATTVAAGRAQGSLAPSGSDASATSARKSDPMAMLDAMTFCQEHSVKECAAACSEGKQVMCVELGDIYLRGQRAAKDEPKAVSLFEAACTSGEGSGCFHLAALTMPLNCGAGQACTTANTGGTIPRDAATFHAYASRACDLVPLVGCPLLVMASDNGTVPISAEEKLKALNAACKAGNREACGRAKDLSGQ